MLLLDDVTLARAAAAVRFLNFGSAKFCQDHNQYFASKHSYFSHIKFTPDNNPDPLLFLSVLSSVAVVDAMVRV